jgi:hypothetical protein
VLFDGIFRGALAFVSLLAFCLLAVGAYLQYRARRAARKEWAGNVAAAGIREVVFDARGITCVSDSTQSFYRWDAFTRIVNCRLVLVLFFDAATCLLIPKTEINEEEAARVLEWKRGFTAGTSEAEPAWESPDVALRAQLDHRDYWDFVVLHRRMWRPSAKVRRWLLIASLVVVMVFLAWMIVSQLRENWGKPWDRVRIWDTFSVAALVVNVELLLCGSLMLIRWRMWRDVRERVAAPEMIRMNDLGVEVRGDRCRLIHRWDAFNRVDVGGRIVYMGLVGGGAVAIPRRQIPMEEESLMNYLQRHVMAVTQAFPVEVGGTTT